MLKLPGWDVSSHFKLICLLVLHCRVLLRNDRSDCSDGRLRCGLLFGRLCKCLLELFIGDILDICHLNDLLELSFGRLSGHDGINFMFGLPRRIVLRERWFDSGDWSLCCGHLFRCFSDSVLKLPGWDV